MRGRARFVNNFKAGPYAHMLPIKKRRYSQAIPQAQYTSPLFPTAPRKRFKTAPRANPGVNKGFTRAGGFYGRYGNAARELGLIPEKKFHDVSLSFLYDTTPETASTGATGQLDLIPQGDTQITRDGRQCTILSIEVKGLITYVPAAAAIASGATFMWLILDTQTNGAQASFADVFDGATPNVALNNLANSTRFRTLKKWVHTWNPQAGVTTAFNNHTRVIDMFKKVSIPLEFSSTTGAITELRTNHVFLAFGSAGTGIDDTVSFTGVARLRFRG